MNNNIKDEDISKDIKLNSYNQTDVDFKNMIDYIKERDFEEIKNAIIYNFKLKSDTDKINYGLISSFYNKHKLWGNIDLKSQEYELIDNNANTLVNDREQIEWLYSNLADYKSKRILVTILCYWLMLDYRRVDGIIDKTYSQYFDLDIVSCDSNEVFVDIGGYIGDTIYSYVSQFGKEQYKKIYCYEIVPANVEYIKANIEKFDIPNVIICEKGASNENGKMFIEKDESSSILQLKKSGLICVDTVTVDDDIEGPVTFIKMDIEGGEEKALLGCRKKILEYHPKLALSVYHNNTHLWKLAKIIDEIDPTYKFYLRYYGGALLPTEYILYAI